LTKIGAFMRKILSNLDFSILKILIEYKAKFTSWAITKILHPELDKILDLKMKSRMLKKNNASMIQNLAKLYRYGFILCDLSNPKKKLYSLNNSKIIFKPWLEIKHGKRKLYFKNVILIKANGDWELYQLC